jgi:dephospho-CoA kinase
MREDDVRARIAQQATRDERLARADIVVDNSGTLDQLRHRVEEVWSWIQGLRT